MSQQNSTPDIHPLTRLVGYANSYRSDIYWAVTYSILNKIFDLAPPALIGAAIDIVSNQQNSFMARFGIEDLISQLWVLGFITIFIWGAESAFQYAYSVKWRNLAQSLQHEIRVDTYDHVQNLEVAYFEDRSTGGLMSILNNDINQLEQFLNTGANSIIQVVTTVITIGALFLISAPSVSWMAVLPMPFVFWGSAAFQKRLAPLYATVRERVSLLNSQLSNNFGGIATIKSFTAETYETDRVRAESEAYRASNEKAIRLSSAFVPLIRMIISVGFMSILVFGGRLALNGELNIGLYSVLIFMTQRLLWPLTSLGDTLDQYRRAMASIDRIFDLLTTQPKMQNGETPLPEVKGEVVFENVDFAYTYGDNDGPRILKELSLHIGAGQTAAIVGATGSGKSTVVKLLLRFYDVVGGRVTLDGHDIRQLDVNDLRRAIGFVSQDVFLFHGTVRENIAYGSFGASLEAVVEAAKIAEAHEFIAQLPDGYDTIVGERGQKLSGGQRQRISIARAVLKDPPILILDEATSAVDNETEAAIQRSMERIAVGRTTIMIAHRLSTVRNADTIFVLDQGVLREAGQHEKLVAESGIYAGLWRVQTGEKLR